ncbi:hypothetical protein LC605_20760 [Nostoc sp. CHAB 5836]|uniref:class I SAM-dependent methyltransferase n=1 Tax=Nostoc sp. CHAB 5836 TaxID=2780404 RepID=UPI001E449631|nr:class I SAM-dependent methyltransferase [Nostoc sp. CHAB 5836]MCC5617473.1 hypothetical protein [Nostoc sp. CHAB 5836]
MSKKQYLENAIAVLKLLRKKVLSDDERAFLMQFPGGGILKECGVFTDADKPQWLKEGRAELQSLLDCHEWTSLQNAGMLNAHYTAPGVRQAMWEAVTPILRENDIVLDPGCGIGNFYIEMPKHLNLSYSGVEKDCISSAIAKLAHPGANIYHKDFLKWAYPADFDLAIGNVPFTNGVSTMEVEGKRLTIGLHAQFFVAAIAHLAPGGLLAFLTSVSTLDARTPDYIQFREWVHCKCEFLGAVRLPNQGTHDGGTEVTTDLILLRRRACLERSRKELGVTGSAEWLGVGKSHIVGYDGAPAYLSNWYLTNPQYLIGEAKASKLRGKNGNPTTSFALQARPNQDVLGELRALLHSLLKPKHQEVRKMTSESGLSEYTCEIENSNQQQEDNDMATVIPAEKFKSNSVYAFILRQNPKQSGIEIHFPPDCQMDGDNAIKFVAKVMGAGFKQANKNPKLYYAVYTEDLWQRAQSWVQSCKTFDAYELSSDEPVDKTPSRRRYGSSATKEAASTPPAAPNKLLDAISDLLNTKVDPLAENIASCIVERLKAERISRDSDKLRRENEELIAQRNELVESSESLTQMLTDIKAEMVKMQNDYCEIEAKKDAALQQAQKLEDFLELAEFDIAAHKKENELLQAQRDEYAKQLQDLGMLESPGQSAPIFDDDSPVFADELKEESEPVFADESQKPKFDDEEESGFDLDALEGK